MNHSKHPWRHLALLICILLLFIVSPVVVTFRHGILVLNIIGTAVVRGMQMRYFSFMTLTTVGYGDVVPRSSAARTMAALKAVMGQLYLTVLVARLVGLHIVHGQDSPSPDKTGRF